MDRRFGVREDMIRAITIDADSMMLECGSEQACASKIELRE